MRSQRNYQSAVGLSLLLAASLWLQALLGAEVTYEVLHALCLSGTAPLPLPHSSRGPTAASTGQLLKAVPRVSARSSSSSQEGGSRPSTPLRGPTAQVPLPRS